MFIQDALEKMSKYVFIVSAAGFIGLVVSLILLSEFFDPILNIIKIMLGTMFGW
jgi:hypothetical protein